MTTQPEPAAASPARVAARRRPPPGRHARRGVVDEPVDAWSAADDLTELADVDELPPRELDELADEPPETADAASELYFPNLDAFVRDFLVQLYRRNIDRRSAA